jgi:HK97 family phage major capsid protein
MKLIEQLKADRANALQKAETLNAKSINGIMSAEDQASFDAAMSEVEGIDADILALQEKETLEAKANQNRDRLNALRAPLAPRSVVRDYSASDAPRATNVRARVDADPARGYSNVGAFALDVFRMAQGQGISDALRPLAAAQGNNSLAGSEGGFLVPPQFSNAIWDGLNNPAESLLAMCDRYPIEGESMTFPANAETSRANGSRYGGIASYWLNEGAQITKSTPKFRQAKVEPHGLAALVYVTDKLLSSAMALSPYLQRAAADEINFRVGDSIVNGTGAGQPLGIMSSAALVTVAKESSQVAATVVQENVSKMWARLHPRCRKNAVWLYNVDVEPQFDGLNTKIKNVAGSENVGGISNVVWNAEKGLLKGRPVMPVEYCQTLGTLGDLILVDLSMYLAGVRGGVDSAQSMHLRFDYAETAFRFMFNVDGQPWLGNALTPKNGSNTLSSMVALATRA